MVDSHTEQQAFLLRAIGERLGQDPLKRLIKAPGMRAVYRVTIYYHDRRALDSVATVYDMAHRDPELMLVYRGIFSEHPLRHVVPRQRYGQFALALQQAGFDHLKDQPGMPQGGADFWMIERAAGTFLKSVILAPETATDPHIALIDVVKTHLPEALRMITKD